MRMNMSICPECGYYRWVTKTGKFRKHYRHEIDQENNDPCPYSGKPVAPEITGEKGADRGR